MNYTSVALAAFLMLLCAACASGGGAEHHVEALQLQRQAAEVRAMPCPTGVEPAVWSELTNALADALLARGTSDAPVSTAAQSALSYNEAKGAFEWKYYAPGDYDQNGEVNGADLVPVAANFRAGGPFLPNSIGAIVDGDGNGEVNGADIVPIAANFGRRVLGYRLYESATPDPPAPDEPSAGISLLNQPFSQRIGNAAAERVRFELPFTPLEGMYYWLRPYDGSHEGIPSTVAGKGLLQLELVNKPPGGGLEENPYQADFEIDYFLRVRTPDGTDVSADPLTTYTISDPLAGSIGADGRVDIHDLFRGVFSVAASHDGESAVPGDLYFVVTGAGPNRKPRPELKPIQLPGENYFSFDASESYDPDGDALLFEWDFDEDGEYELDSGDNPVVEHDFGAAATGTALVTVRVSDPEGLSDTATRGVFLSHPVDDDPPVAVIMPTPSSGEAPVTFEFNASGSSDTHGGIVEHRWDLNNDGEWDWIAPSYSKSVYETFYLAGEYTVRLEVVDDEGDTAQTSVTVEVLPATPDDDPPTAELIADVTSGVVPLKVHLSWENSFDTNGPCTYGIDFNNDGTADYSTFHRYGGITYIYNEAPPGTYTVTLIVTDDEGEVATDSVEITILEGE